MKQFSKCSLAALALAWIPICANAQVTRESMVAGQVVSASSGNVAAAVATATLAAPAATGGISPVPAWVVTGFEITGSGATAASEITCTLTGTLGGTLSYNINIPAGVTAAVTPTIINFPGGLYVNPGVSAVLSCPSFGAGNTNASANLHGIVGR